MRSELFIFLSVSYGIFITAICSAQNISIAQISDNAGIEADRRPIKVGLYDSTANHTFINRDHQ